MYPFSPRLPSHPGCEQSCLCYRVGPRNYILTFKKVPLIGKVKMNYVFITRGWKEIFIDVVNVVLQKTFGIIL